MCLASVPYFCSQILCNNTRLKKKNILRFSLTFALISDLVDSLPSVGGEREEGEGGSAKSDLLIPQALIIADP